MGRFIMFRKLLLSALGAGIVVCVAITALQAFTTGPLILHSETFEGGGHEHSAAAHDLGVGAAAHNHDQASAAADEAKDWAPADGAQRTVFTALANLVVGVGVSLVLIAVMVLSGRPTDARTGVLWGAGAFVAVSLLPSLGLPPELPGTPAGELLQRQLWWVGTGAVSALGLALIAFGRSWLAAVAGVAVIVAPHLIGAPVPPSHDVSYPGALAGEFVVASLVVSAVMWLFSGAVVGWLYHRLSRAA
jgi:cobalt transporter subunit CbtA